MELEMEIPATPPLDLDAALARLNAAATQLEQAASRFNSVELEASVTLQTSLEERLREAEATIAQLRAEAAARTPARRTTPGAVGTLVARDGSPAEPAALDTALRSLSLEQRIAVKSELLRAGLLT
jgi:exonuclease VII small subunit